MADNGLNFPHGFPVVLSFVVSNVAQGGTTNGTLTSTLTSGYIVPTGYNFHAVAISVYGNAARTAGTATFKITDDGTALATGPEALIDDTNTQKHSDTERVGVAPVAAGSVVGVDAVGDASWAPATADYDVTVHGILIPA